MSRFIDLTGQKFGRLTVIERVENTTSGKARWKCSCSCGSITIVDTHKLKSGHTKSCGCYQKDLTGKRFTTHGLRSHPLYRIWWDMKNRCYRPNRDRYNCYGGRGITICDEWKNDFKAFYDWSIANGWEKGLTIDRIDVDGNYEPSNCRWVTYNEQAQNKRNTQWVTYNGTTKNLKQWSKELGIKYHTLYMRVNRSGWSIEKAFTTSIIRKDEN